MELTPAILLTRLYEHPSGYGLRESDLLLDEYWSLQVLVNLGLAHRYLRGHMGWHYALTHVGCRPIGNMESWSSRVERAKRYQRQRKSLRESGKAA